MDYPEPSETHFVRCLKCLKILKCSRYDTTALLEHIRTDHPEIEIVESPAKKAAAGAAGGAPAECESGCKGLQNPPQPNQLIIQSQKVKPGLPEIRICDETCPLDSHEIAVCNEGACAGAGEPEDEEAKVIYTRRYKVHSAAPPPVRSPRRRSLYRTSIEKWRPANGTIYCPRCGCNKRPMIKTHSERMAHNSCGAACILGCWPFCFLPCLLPGQNKEYLHCANCKNFLGLYDRESNCVKPNREFVTEVTETVQRETVDHE